MLKQIAKVTTISLVFGLGLTGVVNAATITGSYGNFLIPDAEVHWSFNIDSNNLLDRKLVSEIDPTITDNNLFYEQYNVDVLVNYLGFQGGAIYFNNDRGNEVAFNLRTIGEGAGSFNINSSNGSVNYERYVDLFGNVIYENLQFNLFASSDTSDSKNLIYVAYYKAIPEATLFPYKEVSFSSSHSSSINSNYEEVSSYERNEGYQISYNSLETVMEDNFNSLGVQVSNLIYNDPNLLDVTSIVGYNKGRLEENNSSSAYRFVPNEIVVDPDPNPQPVSTPEPSALVALAGATLLAFGFKKSQRA